MELRLISPKEVGHSGLCIGCGGCVASSGRDDTLMRFDRNGHLKPDGPKEWLSAKSETLARTCPFSPSARDEDEIASLLFQDAPYHPLIGRHLASYVGYVEENGFRSNGSAGGLASWVLAELLSKGMIDGGVHVAAVDPVADGRFFRYRISRSVEEINQGAKSRYYPIELSEVLREIRRTPGRYAVVGVPCFIKAVHLLRMEDPVLRERIVYTLGLFCGHMKSARMVESFALQMGVDPDLIRKVEFRLKDPDRPASTYTAEFLLEDGSRVKRDWWNLVDGDWGSGFFMNSACNYCDDVVAETADISFGDAWVEPYASDGRGTSVVVVRNRQLLDLIEGAIVEGRLHLEPVDAELVVETQAAGFRQRREGLAYRLTWPKGGIRPRKRVEPSRNQPLKRKLIYRMRAFITVWSHRTFRWADRWKKPSIFLGWSKIAVAIYHGLAYQQGRAGAFFQRIGLK